MLYDDYYSDSSIPGTIPCVVHDGVEAMGNSEHGAVFKLCADGRLNESISLQVHSSGGLVQNQDLGFPQQGSGKAHELALS